METVSIVIASILGTYYGVGILYFLYINCSSDKTRRSYIFLEQ